MAKTGKKPTDRSDATLVTRALSGEQAAFSQLLSKYRDALLQHIQKYVIVREDAEDICQRSFEKAFMNIGRFDPKYAFSTWLYNIARNEAIDHRRRSRSSINSVTISTDQEAFNVLAEATPEQQVIIGQGVGQLLGSIASLPEIYRTVAEYRFIKDYSYEDMAAELDIPVGTVKTRLNRARKLLAEKYERYGDGSDS